MSSKISLEVANATVHVVNPGQCNSSLQCSGGVVIFLAWKYLNLQETK